jgi:hypothetical protein
MMKMETITEDNEIFNYDNAIGKIIMVWIDKRETPFHGQLIKHNYYHIMITNRHGYKILIPKSEIFHAQLTFRSNDF